MTKSAILYQKKDNNSQNAYFKPSFFQQDLRIHISLIKILLFFVFFSLSKSSNDEGVALLNLLVSETPASWPDPTAEPEPCVGWTSIGCSNGHVVSINFQNENLNTTLDGQWLPSLKYLEIVIFDQNHFRGAIPSEFGQLSKITNLNLQNNSFNGQIPSSLNNLKNLVSFNVSFNNLHGNVPTNLQSFPCSAFIGNLKLNGITNKTQCSQNTNSSSASNSTSSSPTALKKSTKSNIGLILGLVFGSVLVLIILSFIALFILRKKTEESSITPTQSLINDEFERSITRGQFGQLRRFTLRELKDATLSFSAVNELGEGGVGKVYKGILPSNVQIAVKRLKDVHKAAAVDQFTNELNLISRAVHRNLMPMLGFCIEEGERMLVFPYMSNGSVASHLKGPGRRASDLSWEQRKKIALGTAEGLNYMHRDCDPKLVHRDVKGANILLDNEFEPVIADFGLAKLIDYEENHVTTCVRGTVGHIAPECFITGQASDKSDVYSYGIFLLEIVTGQDILQLIQAEEDRQIYDWLFEQLHLRNIRGIADSDLQLSDEETREVQHVLCISLQCLHRDPLQRPTMTECVSMLQGDHLVERWSLWRNNEVIEAQVANMAPEPIPRYYSLDTEVTAEAFALTGPR